MRAFYHRRRLWHRLFYWLVVPPVLLFTLGNIALNSTWSKRRVATLLERGSGEEWSIGTLTFSPSGTLHVYAAESAFEEGLVRVEQVAIRPNYSMLLGGRVRFSSVHLTRPELELRDTWLLARLKQKSVEERAPIQVAGSAENNDAPAQRTGPNEATLQEGEQAGTSQASEESALVDKRIEVKPSAGGGTVGSLDPEDVYESWLKVSEARIVIKSATGNLVELHGLNADLPVGGSDLIGEVAWSGLDLLEREIVGDGAIRVAKNGPLLSVKETEVDFFGVMLRPHIYMGRGPRGPAFHIDLQIPEQSVAELFTHLDLTMDLSAEKVAGRMQLAGEFSRPTRWRGVADVRAEGLRAAEGHRGTTAYFDHFIYQSFLDRGVVEMPQVRLQGEEIAVMGNGVLRMDGLGFGVLRVVASPEKKGWIEKLSSGSRVFGALRGEVMQPLVTNDLYYLDLKLDGDIQSPMMQIDGRTDWQPLWPAFGRLSTFVKEERLEDQNSEQSNTTKGQR